MSSLSRPAMCNRLTSKLASLLPFLLFAQRYFFWGLAAIFAVSQVFCGLTNDTRAMLFFSVEFLKHGNFYQHWFEINPPLFLLVYSIPAVAVMWLKLPAAFSFQAYGVLLGVACVLSIREILNNPSIESAWRTRMVNATLFVIFVLPSSVDVFGDRDHLLFIFSLPWIMQMLWGIPPTWRTIIPAAIGFCIKPHSLLIAAALILFSPDRPRTLQALRARVFSPSALIMGGVVCLYLMLIFWAFRPYVFDILPLLLTAYQSLRNPIMERLPLFLFCTIVPCFFILMRQSQLRNYTAWYTFILVSSSRSLLDNGWIYTHYLIFVPFVLTCFRTQPFEDFRYKNWREMTAEFAFRTPALVWVIVWFVWCSMQGTYHNVLSTIRTGYSMNFTYLPNLLHKDLEKAAGKEFVMLSTSIGGIALTDFGNVPKSAYAFDFLWPVPWLNSHQNDERAPWVMTVVGRRLVDTLNQNPAPTLIVDESPYKIGLPYDYDMFGFLRTHYPMLDDALARYKLEGTLDYCQPSLLFTWACRFNVYKPITADDIP